MRRLPVELHIFRAANGRQPFTDWFMTLEDRSVRARVARRLDRLQAGNPGDFRSLGAGLQELRLDTGPGYRVYFSQVSPGLYLVLSGGSKGTQVADIQRARKWLEESRKRASR